MKFRHGFVSNSSSSSFIIIRYSNMEPRGSYKGVVMETAYWETKFGWQVREYYGIEEKINFAALQAILTGTETEQRLAMLREVVLEYTEADDLIIDLFDEDGEYDYDRGYIDHASVGYGNDEMFDSKQILINFLFSNDSYIQNDNDNH